MSLTLTGAVVAAAALFLFLAERTVPLRIQRCPWLRELAINVALSALAFRKQRDYWMRPGGERVQREPEDLGPNLRRLED